MAGKSKKDLLTKTLSDALSFIYHYKLEVFCLVMIWAALFLSLSYANSKTVTTQSRALGLPGCNSAQTPACNQSGSCRNTCWGIAWSTCDSTGRWGCDANCNIDQSLTNPWCEGTTQKTCHGGTITQVIDSPACGGGAGGPCSGRTGSICEGVGGNDGSVSVLNCTGSTQIYTCQKNHTRFTNPTACNSAQRTDNWSSYDGMQIVAGARGTCSVDSGGDCDIGQADITNNSTLPGVCWDVVKTCTNCTLPTPTNTPRLTPTSTPTPTPIPCDDPCDGFSDRRCAAGLTCQPYGVAFLCKSPNCPIEHQTNCRCLNITPTPTTILARCVRLAPDKPLNTLKIGDEVVFAVGYTDLGLVEDIAFRVFKDGQVLETRFQLTNPTGFLRFHFANPGRYSFAAYVKSMGVWR